MNSSGGPDRVELMLVSFPVAVLPFVSPWLFAAGAASISIPIIIHLLNRRRFRQKPWAAMQFLIAAYRRNVRRLKLQRLLLLLLRCLALLLLAAGIAQFIPFSRGLSALMGSGSRLTIIVWNNAYPMGYVPASGGSPFARSRRLLKHWSEQLIGGQWVAIIGAAKGSGPLLEKPVPASPSVTALIARQKVTEGGLSLAPALARAASLAHKWQKRAAAVRVWVVTDDAASDFGCPNGSNPLAHPSPHVEDIRRAVKAIKKAGASFRVFDVGHAGAVNMAITHLRFSRPAILIGHNIHVRLTLLNSGQQAEPNVGVHFFIDGVSAGRQTVGTLRGEESLTSDMLLPNPVDTAGWHDLTARIVTDGLPIDNVRSRIFKARRAIGVLLVDGRPGDPSQGVLASTAWLEAALAPAAKGNRFNPRRIEMTDLPEANLRHDAAVVLSDVAPPDAADLQRLMAFVRRGGTLVIYPGREADTSAWSHLAGGLLPAEFGPRVTTPKNRPQTLDVVRSTRTITGPFIAAQRQGIHTGIFNITIDQYTPLLVRPHAEILLKMRGGKPLLVAGNFGKGKVAMWGTTCDTQWTNLPAQPSFLPLIYRVFDRVLTAGGQRRNVQVGQRLVLRPHGHASLKLRGPDGQIMALKEHLIGSKHSHHLQLSSPPFDSAGVYKAGNGTPTVAVNVDAAGNANIAHVSTALAARCFGVLPDRIVGEPTQLHSHRSKSTGPAGNVGWLMLLLGLMILASEALAARAFSRYRLSTQLTGAHA